MMYTIYRGQLFPAMRIMLLLLLFVVQGGRGYPGGAPDMACQSMLPTGHGVGPLASDPPYTIFVSKKSYKAGETLQVVVQSIGDEYFKGIFLQARMTGCNVNETKTVGVFTSTDQDLMTRHCFGDVHSAVTHNSARKKQHKSFYWTAPVVTLGHVVMRATFVRELSEYWTRVDSPVVADLHATVSPRCLPTLPPPDTTHRPVATTKQGPVATTSAAVKRDSTTTDASTSTPPSAGDQTSGAEVVEAVDHDPVTGQTKTIAETITTTTTTENTADRDQEDPESPLKVHTPTTVGPVEENLPPWLGPAFNHKEKGAGPPGAEGGEGEEGGPSWLIPAYQKGASSSSSLVVLRHWCCHCAMLVVSWVGALFLMS